MYVFEPLKSAVERLHTQNIAPGVNLLTQYNIMCARTDCGTTCYFWLVQSSYGALLIDIEINQ